MKQHTRAKIAAVLCAMLLCVSALGTTAYAATVVVIDLADIVDETAPSVVEVFTETKQVSQFFHEYMTERGRKRRDPDSGWLYRHESPCR